MKISRLDVFLKELAVFTRRLDGKTKLTILFVLVVGFSSVTRGSEPAWNDVKHVGAPSRFFVDVERYRWDRPAMWDTAFYPIPQDPVTRDTYMKCIDASDPAQIAANPKRGMGAPQVFMPVLAKYVQTGDTGWGEAVIAMLKAFHEAMRREVKEKKWLEQFEFPAAYLPIYRQCLIDGGIMKADAPWFRDLYLYYCRNLHVWNGEETEWRGPCHRSIPEAMSKALAVQWYPEIPEAAHWKRYSELVFGDFWQHKDFPQNDTGYMFTMLTPLICGGDQWQGDERIFRHPKMQLIWERLLTEVSPDGAINPYGPNGGWNSSSLKRLYMLERIAAKTGDGRYRFAAGKILNYLRYQADASDADSYRISAEYTALAWLFADDRVKPVCPDSASLWNERVEMARVPHTDKELIERLLGHADPDPLKGHLCCAHHLTGKVWPNKLVLRGGWDPGDFYVLVDLYPTSFPANPGGIMGLTRYGAPFTQIVTSKGGTVENRLAIEDLDNRVQRRYHADAFRIDEYWVRGKMPDIRSQLTYFRDTAQATYARLRVENADGLPVVYEREFVFVKSGLLATREIVTFAEGFKTRVGTVWNTQNIGPQIGDHWANTFMSTPVADNGRKSMKAPPVDLLVWFAPRADRRLWVLDRQLSDPRTRDCPNQLRYVWEGDSQVGQQLVFTQVYYVHMPHRPLAANNNPNRSFATVYADKLQATAGAAAITVERDDVKATLLRIEFTPGEVEYVVFNPGKETLTAGSTQTREPYRYLKATK